MSGARWLAIGVTAVGVAFAALETLEKAEKLRERFPAIAAFWQGHGQVILFVVIVVLSALLWYFAWVEKSLRKQLAEKSTAARLREVRQPVLVLFPEFRGSFYQNHLSLLVHHAANCAEGHLHMVLVPYKVPETTAPELYLDRLLKEEGLPMRPRGVFLIPKEPQQNKSLLMSFQQTQDELGEEGVRLVLLDVYPITIEQMRPAIHEENSLVEQFLHFVGGHEVLGGEFAAKLAFDHLRKRHRAFVNIVILQGALTPWETQRTSGFKRKLAELFGTGSDQPPELRFLDSPALDYDFGQALTYVSDCVDVSLWGEDQQRLLVDEIDLIFACNDDMARGARDALNGTEPGIGPKIIGYDGTSAMKALINSGDRRVLGTIDVRADDQAKAAVTMMHALLGNTRPTKRTHLIKPRVFPPVHRDA